jgi:hypothetical protein
MRTDLTGATALICSLPYRSLRPELSLLLAIFKCSVPGTTTFFHSVTHYQNFIVVRVRCLL